jgi:hypothetical protein
MVTETDVTPLGTAFAYVSVNAPGIATVAAVEATKLVLPTSAPCTGSVPIGVGVDGVGVQVAPLGHDDVGRVVVVVPVVVVVVAPVVVVVVVVVDTVMVVWSDDGVEELLPPPPQPTTSEDNAIIRIFFILCFLLTNQTFPVAGG